MSNIIRTPASSIKAARNNLIILSGYFYLATGLALLFPSSVTDIATRIAPLVSIFLIIRFTHYHEALRGVAPAVYNAGIISLILHPATFIQFEAYNVRRLYELLVPSGIELLRLFDVKVWPAVQSAVIGTGLIIAISIGFTVVVRLSRKKLQDALPYKSTAPEAFDDIANPSSEVAKAAHHVRDASRIELIINLISFALVAFIVITSNHGTKEGAMLAIVPLMISGVASLILLPLKMFYIFAGRLYRNAPKIVGLAALATATNAWILAFIFESLLEGL
jgi:hypothetical protein